MTRLARLALLTGLLLAGCGTGPHYEGGPTDEDPYGIVSPGEDVFIYAVDGQRTTTRAFGVLVHPGERNLRLRVQHPINSEAPEPQDYVNETITVEDGVEYYIERKPGEIPPFGLKISERRFR